MKILAKDILAFWLPRPRIGEGYRHLPLLFKPGPSPAGAFTPIVSANFTASSGPVTGEKCT